MDATKLFRKPGSHFCTNLQSQPESCLPPLCFCTFNHTYKYPYKGDLAALTMANEPVDIRITDAPHTTTLNPEFHRRNRFFIDSASEATRWLTEIGPANASHITMVRIVVPAKYNWLDLDAPLTGHQWCDFFAFLVEQATGLREVGVLFDCDVEEWKEGFLGGGSDPDMCLALESLRGLEELVFTGYYDEEWPVFFGERLGLKVVELKGELEAKEELNEAERAYLENLAVYRRVS